MSSEVGFSAGRQARLGRRSPRHGWLGDRAPARARGLRGPHCRTADSRSARIRRATPRGCRTRSRTPCSWRRPRSAASSPTTRYPAEFLYDNLMIEANVIEAAYRAKVSKSFFSSARAASIRNSRPSRSRKRRLLTGPLEPTNEWYAIAKIAGIKLCQAYRKQYGCDFISAMPTNLYGPGDNFDLQHQPRHARPDPQGA